MKQISFGQIIGIVSVDWFDFDVDWYKLPWSIFHLTYIYQTNKQFMRLERMNWQCLCAAATFDTLDGTVTDMHSPIYNFRSIWE